MQGKISSEFIVCSDYLGDFSTNFTTSRQIKPHKKHKMPSWIVFNEQHTSMYPELFIAMNFKRGSQNRNWAGKIKTAEDYVHANGKSSHAVFLFVFAVAITLSAESRQEK